MNPLEILSRIYSLLSECKGDEIRAAADIAQASPELAQALKSLAAAKRQIEQRQGAPKRQTSPSQAKPTEAAAPSQGKDRANNGYDAVLRQLVLEKQVFDSNEDLVRYLNGLDLGISFRRKDGRSEMLNRLLRHFSSLNYEQRREALSRIMPVLPKSETAGWFEAIRREAQ